MGNVAVVATGVFLSYRPGGLPTITWMGSSACLRARWLLASMVGMGGCWGFSSKVSVSTTPPNG